MADSLRRPHRSDLRAVAGAALLAVAYTLAISLASAISAPAVTIAPIRPPNAIALAVFLLVSPADWWLYLIGLCAANVFGAATIGRGLWYALANGTEVLGAAFLLRRVTRRSPRLDTLEECLLFVAIAGVIAPIAGATLGSPAVARLSPTVETLVAWRTWFLGDAVANITIAPALLGVYALVRSGGGAAKPARVAEATALGLSLLAASLPTLGLTGSIPGLRAASLSLLYVPFPLLVWAAIRFGPCGAAFSNLLLTALAVTSALRDSGPFSRLANPDGVIVLQQFLAIAGATALTLAGLMADRRRATAALAASEAEQLQTAQSAATSRALLASVINSTDELVWLIEPRTHRLTLFNAAFAAYFRTHYQVALEPGMKLDDVLEPDRAATWHGLYDRALTEGPFTIEYSTDRGHLILLLSFSPVSDHGRVSGVSVFGKDITARKRAEDERDQMQTQLLQAQKMESLGRLAGGVAHDFNNMLTGMMGYAELMLNDEPDPVRRAHLQAIMSTAARSADLTRKLLAFGRRGRNLVEAVEIGAVVRDSVAMLRPTFRPNVNVVLQLHDHWTADADPSQLSQIVVNLCINANEAMPDGGDLTIRTADVHQGTDGTRPRLRVGDCVELSVADSGVGMSDDVQQRMFEPFFTTKTGGKVTGTGLGLSTVYGIVQMHHGAIDVESAPGRGTRFTIRLPRGSRPLTPPPPERDARTGGGLILIVEDEDVLRSFAVTALTRLGYDVITAVDGDDGIRVFRERHAELTGVMLDLKMPGKGGREAFLAFRDIAPDVPVFICSGYGDNDEAQGLISLGAVGLLAKPYRLAELSEQLGRLRPTRPSPHDGGARPGEPGRA